MAKKKGALLRPSLRETGHPGSDRYRCSLSGLAGFTANSPSGFPGVKKWRRGEDSNLRYPFGYTHFPGVLLKPCSDTSPRGRTN